MSEHAEVVTARDPGTDSNRREMFDVLRLLAAAFVVLSHSFWIAGDLEPVPLRWHNASATFGILGVEIFFVLSGYWVVSSWMAAPRTKPFAVKRISRIFPGLIVALAITTFVIGPLVTSRPVSSYLTDPRTAQYFAYNAPIVHPVNPPGTLPGVFTSNIIKGKVNGSLWTLALELTAYAFIFAAGLAALVRRRWPVLVMLAAAGAGYAVKGYVPFDARETSAFLLWMPPKPLVALLAFFFAGSAIYLYRERIPMRWPVFGLAAAVLAGSLVVGWSIGGLLTIPYMVIFLGTRRVPGVRPITRLGDPSYGAYLYAFPVQQTLYQWRVGGRNPWVIFAVATVVAFGLGYASWHAIERPALRFGRRLIKRRASAAEPVVTPTTEPALAVD